jgi:hypothetical protein
MRQDLKVIYTSYQNYTLHLAEKLFDKHGWQPIYWFTDKLAEKKIKQIFPNVITHDYIKAIKGIKPEGFEINHIYPLDEKILNEMSVYESIALNMMERNDGNNCFSYKERLELYHYFLSYWLNALNQLKPDIIIMEEEPHQAVDYILYRLAIFLRIKTIMFVRTSFESRMFPVMIFENGSEIIKENYEKKISSSTFQEITLSSDIKGFINKLNGNYDEVRLIQLYDQVDKINELRSNKISKKVIAFVLRIFKFFNILKFTKRANFLISLFRVDENSDQKLNGLAFRDSKSTNLQTLQLKRHTFKRKLTLKKYYESIASKNIILDTPYIICALSYQPEKTTSPMGGQFVNQRLMIKMLRSAMPTDWKLYIKDHISQFSWYTDFGEQHRSIEFYDEIRSLPNTDLVPLFYDTFSLIDNCKAVATVTGSIGFEAVVRNKPVLTFGHPWYKFCEGVFYTSEFEHLKQVIDNIKGGYIPNKTNVELFIQTIQENTFRGVVGGKTITSHAGERGSPEANSEEHYKSIMSLLAYNEQYQNNTQARY